LFMSL